MLEEETELRDLQSPNIQESMNYIVCSRHRWKNRKDYSKDTLY